MNEYGSYIKSEGLDQLIDFRESAKYLKGGIDTVSGKFRTPFPPEPEDLAYLHKIIRQRKCFTVLEFGIGYSTIIIADALRKNKKEWEALAHKPAIRNRFMFQVFSVDASKKWIKSVKKIIPNDFCSMVHLQYSLVEIGTFNGQLCHFYKDLPDIVPDFIYLDGPSPKDVKGNINGLSFQCDERTVMSGDLLLMEPTFLPGTFILVDGRTNNTRFLKNNFKRKYEINWDKKRDVTTIELTEDRLGKYNLLGADFLK
ncbi:MAG: hypothetical protein HQL12_01975 [Candidatus Omnitrophica bacterium]|nr:hypothetical protein [Candidatus Omnitrophota bacterium]